MVIYDKLDPLINKFDSQTTPMKELKSFSLYFQDSTKSSQVGNDLTQGANEKLKSLLCKNLDIFTWKREDMIDIDPKVS